MAKPSPTSKLVTREHFDAVLFDMDGVLTDTARVHAACWKEMFDQYLQQRSEALGELFVPFEVATDYKRYVDGKLRDDGVRSFLRSRKIELPEGDAEAGPEQESIWGLASRKNRLVGKVLSEQGVEVYEGSVRWLRQLREAGFRTAVVSASRNCARLLQVAKLEDQFETRVDGTVAAELALPGKPAPDTFLEAARRLDTPPARAVVVEDATSGVEAGRRGGFGLVIGVDRHGDPDALRAHGAHRVVSDLGELL